MARSYQFAWEEAMMDSDLPAGLKHLGHALRSYASDDGTNIYPGVEALARRMSKSPRQVIRDLEALRDRGWIKRVRRGNKRAGLADVYSLTTPVQVTPMSRSEECTDQSQSVQVTPMSPNREERPDQVTSGPVYVTSATVLGDTHVTPIPMNTQGNNQGEPATLVASLPIFKFTRPSEVTEPEPSVWDLIEAEPAKPAHPVAPVDPVPVRNPDPWEEALKAPTVPTHSPPIARTTEHPSGVSGGEEVPDDGEEGNQVRPAPDGPASSFSGETLSLAERDRRRRELLAEREASLPPKGTSRYATPW